LDIHPVAVRPFGEGHAPDARQVCARLGDKWLASVCADDIPAHVLERAKHLSLFAAN
jgi:hypothetical protein